MKRGHLTTALVAAAIAFGPAERVSADAGDFVAGALIGGVVGAAINNDIRNKRAAQQQQPTRRTTTPSYNTAARETNRQVQTALNYFGFPAGTPDGVMGRNSRNAVSQYQAFLGYSPTGQLTQYEQDFLLTSYNRAIAGGAYTTQQIAGNPMGPKGLLIDYRNEAAGLTNPAPAQPAVTTAAAPTTVAPPPTVVVPAPVTVVAPATGADVAAQGSTLPVVAGAGAAAAPAPAIPNFGGTARVEQASLASRCNEVSLVTNSNGGFTKASDMTDPEFSLSEQFCLARTYAIADGEKLAAKVQGSTPQQIAAQCDGFAPAMKPYIDKLALESWDALLTEVKSFAGSTGMSPDDLAATAKICLSAGYRTDNMDVALGSDLVLVALGQPVYGELVGHHLALGYGTVRRPDLALPWYDMAISAQQAGAVAIFAPGQPERNAMIERAAYVLAGQPDPFAAATSEAVPQPAAVTPAPVLPNLKAKK